MSQDRIGRFFRLFRAGGYLYLAIPFLGLNVLTASAQGFASLAGTVKDSSGAVIPAAEVTATQAQTGAVYTVKTNSAGNFVFPTLSPATYNLSATAASFAKYVQNGLVLEANQSVNVNVNLRVGSDEQTVVVAADAPQVDTTTGTLSQVIDTRRVNDLPLNGRNAATLSTLVAGVVVGPNENTDQGPAKTFPVAVTISANGSRVGETSYMLDGANNMDEYTNVNGPFPFPDALQEFSVQTSNYNAEYGQNSGGVVNIVTKSGGDAFHGDAFEYIRNAALNARNYFASAVDPLHRHQFGGTVGGPVRIPHLFDLRHTFFFVGYQHTIYHDQLGGTSAYVPTQANLQGNFANVLTVSPDNPLGKATMILDPKTGKQFQGNMIPQNRLDPAALAFSKDLPSATGNGLIFYQQPVTESYNEYLIRVDRDIGSSDHIFAHYYSNTFEQAGQLNPANLLTYTSESNIPFRSAVISETHIFSPTVVNNFVLGYTNEISTRAPLPGGPNAASFGVNIYQPPTPALETIAAKGFFSVGDSPPAVFQRNDYILGDSLHWVKGNHNFAFGLNAELSKQDTNNQTKESGVFNFAATKTNDALASFMIGYMQTFTQGSGQYLNARNHFIGFYAQDSWKITKRLTLDYGVRYDPFFPWQEIHHRITQFNPADYAAGIHSSLYSNAPAGMLFSGDAGVPEQGVKPVFTCVAPRFGFAWDAFGNGKTSLRGGGGTFYDTRQPSIMLNNLGASSTPFSVQVTYTQPAGPFSNPYLGSTNPFPLTPVAIKDTVFPAPVSVTTFDPSGIFQVPAIYSWNLALEQQFTSNLLFRLAYVGSHASHIWASPNLNPSVYIPGSTLSATQRAYYQGYGGISEVNMGGNGSYNSLQATLEQRYSHGLTILLNYTFSKALDDLPYGSSASTAKNGSNSYVYPVYMPNYKALDRGPSDFDHRNVMSASYVYRFPELRSGNVLLRAILNDWRQAGLVQARSGDSLTVLAGVDQSQTNLLQDRAEIVPSQRFYGPGACVTVQACVNYLNPSAFALPAVGQFGNVQKGSLVGPAYVDWDASLLREFGAKERLHFQFRAEYFNVLNHTNLGDPGTTVSDAGFGSITSANDPRIAQLALKAIF